MTSRGVGRVRVEATGRVSISESRTTGTVTSKGNFNKNGVQLLVPLPCRLLESRSQNVPNFQRNLRVFHRAIAQPSWQHQFSSYSSGPCFHHRICWSYIGYVIFLLIHCFIKPKLACRHWGNISYDSSSSLGAQLHPSSHSNQVGR